MVTRRSACNSQPPRWPDSLCPAARLAYIRSSDRPAVTPPVLRFVPERFRPMTPVETAAANLLIELALAEDLGEPPDDLGPHVLDMEALGLSSRDVYLVHDELTGQTWRWCQRAFVRLTHDDPAHVLTLVRYGSSNGADAAAAGRA